MGVETSNRVEETLQEWPSQSREAATKTIERYGPPDDVLPSALVWSAKGPWKRIIVNRDRVPHRFPKPHNDLLEEWIDYRVPPEKVSDLARFDGSVLVERTRGEIGARCDKEEMNYLALNLAHDVITGTTGIDDARRTYTEKAAAFMMGKTDPYTDGLRFSTPSGDTADKDVTTIKEEQ